MTDGEMWGLALQHARVRNMEARLIHGRSLSLKGFSAIMEEWYVPARAPKAVLERENGVSGPLVIRWPVHEAREMAEAFLAEIARHEVKRWRNR